MMRTRLTSALLLASVLFSLSPAAWSQSPAGQASGPAAQDPKEDAMRRFRRAVELYDEQNYEAALIEFRKAYDLAPTYKLRYNIGQVCYQLKDYACALSSFEAYLREGGPEVAPQRRSEVEGEITKLQSRVGRLTVTSNVFGAQVSIDDVVVGQTPLEMPVVVSVGKRRITVSKEGRVTASRVVEVAGAESKSIVIDLAPVPVSTPAAKTPAARTESPSRMTTLSWVGVGATGLLAAGAVTAGLMARSSSDDLSKMRYAGTHPSDEVLDKQNDVKRLALTSDILTGAALVTLGTTLIWTFTRPVAAPAPAEERRALVVPRIGLGSVSLSGEF